MKTKKFTKEEVKEIAYQCVGAASVTLWQTDPLDTFPSQEVIDVVRIALKEWNIDD